MKAVVWALGLALASEASAFVPLSSAIHISSRTSLRSASVVCAAEGVPAGRREVLKRAAAFSGAILLNGPAALAADDDDDDGVNYHILLRAICSIAALRRVNLASKYLDVL
jgi:hypothetical protein